jgi:hypothetical protein
MNTIYRISGMFCYLCYPKYRKKNVTKEYTGNFSIYIMKNLNSKHITINVLKAVF